MTEQEFLNCYESGRLRSFLLYKSEDQNIGLRFKSLQDTFAHIKSPAFQMEKATEIILEIVFLDSFQINYNAGEKDLTITVREEK
ncbi:MAG: hypothetical protein LBU89_00755 [Fibromonadaceae bacterium]|jgi:hypothetical protein|nr:hypothetical protein [Fibromonadaceae bacterium]